MSQRTRVIVAAVLGLALGAAIGWLAGWIVRSDNAPFSVALGALAGLWGGLAWSRVLRPRVLAAIAAGAALVALLIMVLLAPPRAGIGIAATPRPDGLTADQAATLESLRRVDEYPLYTMRFVREAGPPVADSAGYVSVLGQWSTLSASKGASLPQDAPQACFDALSMPAPLVLSVETSAWACSLFAALGDPANRLYGRNFDWRYSPALLLFTDRPAAGGYASVSLVDIAYFGFDDGTIDLAALPLAERRALLDAPGWPFDGMNEAGVAVGMAAVSTADERSDRDKPAIGSLGVMREVLDHAGSVDEAVAILSSYNIDWEGGPPLHYLVADRTGRAALVEFHDGQIAVLPNAGPWHAATNFTLSAVADSAGQCRRYDTVVQRLAAADGKLTPADALDLLQAVAQTESATQWSVVYGLSTGRVEVVMGREYGRVHTFRLAQR